MAKKETKCAKCAPFKPLTKTQIVAELATKTGLSKKDVSAVFDSLSELIRENLSKANNANFSLPGLIKIEKQHVDAKPAQKNVPDPFHPGKTVDRPAKPAHYKIKVKALKGLKDMA
ncbi:MAG: HU family DNA-binding protein [Planctomycetia bacterium]|nr:HU family DNA-binding protein [Planctomycetia bacterium]